MATDDSRTTAVSSKINSLLAQTTHNDERLLVCCTLLSRMQPSTVVQYLSKHNDLKSYVLRLIRANKDDTANELKRLGIRILSLYMSESHRDNNPTMILNTEDWEVVIGIIAKRSTEEKIIDLFDTELLQFVMMVISMEVAGGDSESKRDGCCINLPSIDALPGLLLRRFCSALTTSCPDKKKESNSAVIYILRNLLDGQHLDGHEALDSFRESMVHFLVAHATLIQTHQGCKSPLDEEFIDNATSLLHGNGKNSEVKLTKIFPQVHSLLHYALLSYVATNISTKGQRESGVSGFCLCSEIRSGNDRIVKHILKLIISGITSYQEMAVNEAAASEMARSLTLKVFMDLLETLGIEWMQSKSNNGNMGESATFCTLVRLFAGELRITLGRLVDLSMVIKDPDNDTTVVIPPQLGDWLLRSEHCIEIGLYALRTMLDLAAQDNDISPPASTFNADAILHIRHSLEDFLDSCVQFLLEDMTDRSFSQWKNCKFACCRFFGAYLAQVNVFDYDVPDDDGKEEEDGITTGTGTDEQKRTTTAINLLQALKNALDVFYQRDDDDDCMKAITLFPCLIAVLTCCEDRRQAKITERYLFKDDTMPSNMVEKILNISTERLERSVSVTLLENISWCCLLVDSMIDVSGKMKKAQHVLNVVQIVRALTRSASLLLVVLEKQPSSCLFKDDIHTTLQQISNTLAGIIYSDCDIVWEEEVFEMMKLLELFHVDP